MWVLMGACIKKIKNKHPGLLTQSVILLHNNACPHKTNFMKDKLALFWWEILTHPPYSPDLLPCNFHIFSEMKNHLKGKKFPLDASVQEAVHEWVSSQSIHHLVPQ